MVNKSDPKGIGGWLLILIIGMGVLGPLSGIGMMGGGFYGAEQTYPVLVANETWQRFKLAEWWFFAAICAAGIYAAYRLAFIHEPQSVRFAIATWWISCAVGPVLIGIIVPGMFFGIQGDQIARGVGSMIGGLLSAWIWTSYLKKSRRVSNTYGLSIATERVEIAAIEPLSTIMDKPIAQIQEQVSQAISQQGSAGACEPAAIQAPKNVVTTTEDDYYEQALGEIETGQTAKAMWARAIADAEGNDAKTKALYIRYRVEKLKALAAEEQARIEAEKLREQRRREAERREEDARRREAMKTAEERRKERARLETLAKKVASDGWVSDAIELIQMIGGKYEIDNRPSFFGNVVTVKIVVTLDGRISEFKEEYQFANWVRNVVAPRVLERVAREQAAQIERL